MTTAATQRAGSGRRELPEPTSPPGPDGETRNVLLPRPPAPRSRRRPAWIAAGLLAVCLGALGAVLVFSQIAGSRSVVLVSTSLARGEVIEAGDLTVVAVGSTPGVSTVPAARLDALIGQHALVDLVAGSLLPADAVGPAALPAGTAQVGLRLAPGRLPQAGLPPGTRVELVAVAGPGGTADGLTGTVTEAVVMSAPVRSGDGQGLLVDVRVAKTAAAEVAQLAAADRLVLIRLPEH